MRARQPDTTDYVSVDNVRIGYEQFRCGDPDQPTVLLLPTWTIVDRRHWKLQVPFLARHFNVLTFDGPGNGLSERTTDTHAYNHGAYARYAEAVLEHSGTSRAVVVGMSKGASYAVHLADLRPDLLAGLVLIGPAINLSATAEQRQAGRKNFLSPAPEDAQGWDRYKLDYWQRDYAGFASWFFDEALSKPHSTKGHDDATRWAKDTTVDVLGADALAESPAQAEQVLRVLGCPTLVVHGDDDRVCPYQFGVAVAEAAQAELITFHGSGHLVHLREPVRLNRTLFDFITSIPNARVTP